MRKAFVLLTYLLLLVVVAEFVFAAIGGFDAGEDRDAYRPHHALGYVIFLLPLVMAIVAVLARLPKRLVVQPLVLAGLTGFQVAIAKLAWAFDDTGDGISVGQVLFGLHAIGGLAVVAVATRIVWQTRALPRSEATVRVSGASVG